MACQGGAGTCTHCPRFTNSVSCVSYLRLLWQPTGAAEAGVHTRCPSWLQVHSRSEWGLQRTDGPRVSKARRVLSSCWAVEVERSGDKWSRVEWSGVTGIEERLLFLERGSSHKSTSWGSSEGGENMQISLWAKTSPLIRFNHYL